MTQLRPITLAEKKANISCATCEANAVCELVKARQRRDWHRNVCAQYVNHKKGIKRERTR